MAFMVPLIPTPLGPREVFTMFGQSNSEGRDRLSGYPTFPPNDSYVKVYNHASTWVDGLEPIGFGSDATYPVFNEPTDAGVSAGMSFASTLYTSRPFRTFGLVPCGVGGTSMAQWQPNVSTATLYGATIARTNAALAANPGSVLKGVIFYQGEAEGSNGAASTWAAQFLNIYDDMCVKFSQPNLKCIVTELGPTPGGRPDWSLVQSQQRSLDGARSGNIVCVSAADLSVMPSDPIHIDRAGQVLLGQRYAAAMAPLLA